jgi:hypothetical protein
VWQHADSDNEPQQQPYSGAAARVSANSYLKRAKCLFGRAILESLGDAALPKPFARV